MSLTLPVVLSVGKIVSSTAGLESSISNYYYTDMRNVFVGSMCVIGLFLAACRGYDRRDAIAGTFAGICAIGLALFPTLPDAAELARGYTIPAWQHPVEGIHLSFSALLFLTVAYFCLRLFPLSSGSVTPQKRIRNRVYKTCGWTVLICIAMCVVAKVFEQRPSLAGFHPVFWFESLATMAFGAAWLTKGEWILKDRNPASEIAYIAAPADEIDGTSYK
jgi:hypothetical protein